MLALTLFVSPSLDSLPLDRLLVCSEFNLSEAALVVAPKTAPLNNSGTRTFVATFAAHSSAGETDHVAVGQLLFEGRSWHEIEHQIVLLGHFFVLRLLLLLELLDAVVAAWQHHWSHSVRQVVESWILKQRLNHFCVNGLAFSEIWVLYPDLAGWLHEPEGYVHAAN
uniref:Uncharacterized protein n=1 Tax=Favella ehrenbergii TaxID=182087 RepID=A0A7S3MPS7_9SPIT|mmetsp:Transcript_36340/g.44339  ORF Transcript_36340/g.44339 Transcript_36340/m.44339 type:complete len:167 (+) Transcript_36340:42-542(+)